MNKHIKRIIACTLIASAVQAPLLAQAATSSDTNEKSTEIQEDSKKTDTNNSKKTDTNNDEKKSTETEGSVEEKKEEGKSTWGKRCKDKEEKEEEKKGDSDKKEEKPNCCKKCEIKEDIVDTAVKNGNFKTLVTALKAADLVDLLKQKGPFTVFAPTDSAFAKLPQGTLDDLLKPENKDKLKGVLSYHVYAGMIQGKDIKEMNCKKIKMSDGKEATITVKDDDVYINDAKIVKAVKTSNGIIYVIDTVLAEK